jgi:hypothetical protein
MVELFYLLVRAPDFYPDSRSYGSVGEREDNDPLYPELNV